MKIIDEFRRGTLCSRTTLTITLVSTTFLIFTLSLIAFFVVIPTAQRSASELASLVLLSTEALQTVEKENREAFKQHLFDQFELDLSAPPDDLYPRQRHAPFFLILEQALKERVGKELKVLQSDKAGRQNHYWVKLKSEGKNIYVGFEYSHKWFDPPAIILFIVVIGFVATFLTGMTLARHLTQPLKQLAASTQQLGSGENIPPLPERGPLELKELVASFNRMSKQIHDLLSNRTTLLAGISHDLRTPLTRMELSLEMMEGNADQTLVSQLRRDISQMNRLIGLFLEISHGLEEGKREKLDVTSLLNEIADEFISSGVNLTWHPGEKSECLIHHLALRRIVVNLIENAVRYSEGKEVTLKAYINKDRDETVIEILDRGPGIPEEELDTVFRPFYRLEQSRSSATGGSGLGLSIVRQLANANGCKVELLAREGNGTIARVTIGK